MPPAELEGNCALRRSYFRSLSAKFAKLDAARVESELSSCSIVFFANDHGHRNQKDRLPVRASGACIIKRKHVSKLLDTAIVTKEGRATAAATYQAAKSIKAAAERFGGTTTDSAPNMLKTQAAEIRRLISEDRQSEPFWIQVVGCAKHGVNKGLEATYFLVFGPADLGEPSVLMMIRSIAWLPRHLRPASQALLIQMARVHGEVRRLLALRARVLRHRRAARGRRPLGQGLAPAPR